jgi:inosine-uridine nucleoside N-ribohydrolase
VRVVLDTDPGVDDALALLFALRCPEIDLVGVTTVAGNVLVDQGTRNARAILAATGRRDVRVYQGADRPLVGRLTTATYFHGEGGLGDLDLPDEPTLAGDCSGSEFLLRAVRYSDAPPTVVAVGPLTNLALACRLDPGWPSRVERIVVMGGAVSVAGNVTSVAEANVYSDPEAAAILFASGAAITMVGLDVTMQTRLSRERWRAAGAQAERSSDPAAVAAARLLDFYVDRATALGVEGPALHDPLAIAAAFQPDLVAVQRLYVEVECVGTHTRGQTVAWLGGMRERVVDCGDHDDVVGVELIEGNIDVCVQVDAGRFLDLFLGRLFGEG